MVIAMFLLGIRPVVIYRLKKPLYVLILGLIEALDLPGLVRIFAQGNGTTAVSLS
jgi:hypothetical protein